MENMEMFPVLQLRCALILIELNQMFIACLFKGSQEQSFFLQTLLFAAFLVTVLKILTYALVSTWFLVSSWWEHVKRKMHPWWWEVKNKVAINSNFRIGAKISAQMHNRSSVLRNLSQICDIWQFSMNPHTPRVYEKLPNIPNIASVSQNRLTREKYFSLLWIFFWVFPKKNVMWFVSQNIFWRHITQT